MVRKIILGIFVSFLAIFAMSHNAGAVDGIYNISDYDIVQDYTDFSVTWTFGNNDTIRLSNAVLDGANHSTVLKAEFPKTDYYIDDIVTVDFIVLYNGYSFTTGQTANGYLTNPLYLPYVLSSNDYTIIDIDELTFDSADRLLNYYISYSCNSIGTGQTCYSYPELTQGVSYFQVFRVTLKMKRTVDDLALLLNSNSTFPLFDFTGFNLSSSTTIRIKPTRWNIYRQTETQENREVEEKTQEAVDESAESGESSQGSVEGSTQSLMSAGASIISALSNAPATDCNINMTTSGSSSAFTGAIGSVNLCSGVPSGVLTMVQGIVALVFTPIVLYYTYSIITTIYKQFREYNS